MGPPPVLSEGEEQFSVEWTTDSSRKRFPHTKMVDPLSVKEFLTVNLSKHFLQITCLGMDGFEHSFAIILSYSRALVKVCVTSLNATLGETDIRK
jgi:hypothetical protein